MATEFIGRRRELDVLESAYRERCSGLWPVYGRRRIGKTELIKRFLTQKPGIYYLGKQAAAPLQIREFLGVAAQVLDEPLLAGQSVASWQEALASVVARWQGPRKLVIALDEFQWIAGSSPELPSILQGLWDGGWRDANNVLLILCGSYVGFMEREVLGKKSPLFGRRTGQIHLQPFGYREAAEFHPRYGIKDRAGVYFICGGVPLYLKAFDQGRSLADNIARQILDVHAPLHSEPEFLLREEFREVERYHGILMAIAAGYRTSKTIANYVGLDPRHLVYYLQQLGQLGYVRRRLPLVPGKPRTGHTRYDIADPLLRFWFRFLFPNLSAVTSLGPRRSLRELVRPHLPAYFGSCFERLCREALPDLMIREGATANVEVGEYWDKESQIDVVAHRDDGVIELGECKWGVVRSPRKVVDELVGRAQRYLNPSNATIGLRIFSAGKAKPVRSDRFATRWTTLDDLYRD